MAIKKPKYEELPFEVALLAFDNDWNSVEIKGEFTGWTPVSKETLELLEEFADNFSGEDCVQNKNLVLVHKVNFQTNPFTLDQIKEMMEAKRQERLAREEARRREREAQQAAKAARAREKAARKAREQLELLIETAGPEEREALLARLLGTGA